MMYRVTRAGVWLALTAGLTWACVSPVNIQGVAFTGDETLDFGALESLGEEGTNYLKDGQEPHLEYRYISHYDSRAMVYVGNYGLSYMSDVYMNCMGVVYPDSLIPDSIGPYGELPREIFDYTQAVLAELGWLVANGVLTITPQGLAAIEAALAGAQNGGVQYWTLQDDLLTYNMWYDYDTLSGTWSTDGTNGVRGVFGMDGCAVVAVDYGTPLEQLASAAVRHGLVGRTAWVSAAARIVPSATGVTVLLASPVRSSALLTLMDLRGVVVARCGLPAGSCRVDLPGVGYGRYAVTMR